MNLIEDQEAVSTFMNEILNSHLNGEETIDMKGNFIGNNYFAKDVAIDGIDAKYDIYFSRVGNFSNDVNRFYSYNKDEVDKVTRYPGKFVKFTIANIVGGKTNIFVPSEQANSFQEDILLLRPIKQKDQTLNFLASIRTANLNGKEKLDISEYVRKTEIGVKNIKYKNKNIKVMLSIPVTTKNSIDPSEKSIIYGKATNALGKENEYQIYEYLNLSKPNYKSSWKTKIYVLKNQKDLLEEYLLISDEVFLDDIKWVSQFDKTLFGECDGCWSKKCCLRGALYMAGLTNCANCNVASISSTIPDSPNEVVRLAQFNNDNNWKTEYNNKTLISVGDINSCFEFIKDEIKNHKRPIIIGTHYTNKTTQPAGNNNKATYHFMTVVGYGADKEGEYVRFYDPGRNKIYQSQATSENNKLYIKDNFIKGSYNNKTYTITEVLKYF